jgi:anaerobic selenocysteine-containing dehydrogenase
VSRLAGASFTFGFNGVWDAGPESGVIVIWGYNGAHLMGGYVKRRLNSALQSGAKLLVVDPKKTDSAKRADMWIRPRPGSDGLLALGMIKALIEGKLYDEEFVEKWTIGFKELKDHVNTFSFDQLEELTWVTESEVRKAAELLAQNPPACLIVGNGLERSLHAFQQIRAIFVLRALLGYLNTPGGNISITVGDFTRPGRFFQLRGSDRTAKIRQGMVIGREFKLAMSSAYIPTQSLVRGILDEKPNPIKAAICILSNPIISYADSNLTYKALMKLDFFVVSELFPTPTSAIADIVLPAAWGAEHDTLGYWPGWFAEIRAYPKIVEPPGEARSDIDWLNELANRVGLGNYFWKSEEEALDYMLEPSGLSWREFKQKRILHPKREYKTYEQGIFKTPSGKVELFAKQLEDIGYSPLPLFKELSNFRFQLSDEYPLLLFNGKEGAYMLTGYKHLKSLRDIKPQPIVELSPLTASEMGLKEGDWVYIETVQGRIKQILSLDPDLHARVVNASFGWWFPEDEGELYQFRKSNLNVLTQSGPPYDKGTGSLELAAIPCRIYKAD